MICTPPGPRRHDRPDDSFVACSPETLAELEKLREIALEMKAALTAMRRAHISDTEDAYPGDPREAAADMTDAALAKAREAGL